MSENLLQVEGLEAGYGDVQILWGISLAAAPATVRLLGPAGSGPGRRSRKSGASCTSG